jgi:hypothetical protein
MSHRPPVLIKMFRRFDSPFERITTRRQNTQIDKCALGKIFVSFVNLIRELIDIFAARHFFNERIWNQTRKIVVRTFDVRNVEIVIVVDGNCKSQHDVFLVEDFRCLADGRIVVLVAVFHDVRIKLAAFFVAIEQTAQESVSSCVKTSI